MGDRRRRRGYDDSKGRDALVSVVRVGSGDGVAPVEVDRCIKSAYILAQETGEIKEGDLLGVLNVLPIMFTREAKKPIAIKD